MTTGRERVQQALRCEAVDRVPWVPFVGVHGAALVGCSAQEYLCQSELIFKGLEQAVQRYAPDGLPIMFDLQLEAEVLGCELKWADDNPPAVVSHPLEIGKTLDDLQIPLPHEGRIGLALEVTRAMRAQHPSLALYGLITGPFTLALHLLGTSIFMKMFDEPEQVHLLMDFCRKTCLAMSQYYIDAGSDVVAIVDPMTSQIGPDQFREFVSPFVRPVFETIRQNNALGSFFVCGHAQQNIEAMCECAPDNISVDENIPLEFVRDVCLSRKISFGGNLQLTSVLLLGTPLDAQRNAVACLELAGEQGFVLAPGCDLPYATPPENLEAVGSVVHDPYQREVVKATVADESSTDLLDLHEYGQTDKVIVDIITLDSEACAPCQYMVESVKQIVPEFEGLVVWREHKIKYRESLVFMTSLMVRNIPTICIDGQIKFVSRIPAKEELIAALQARIYEKLRMKIQRRKATIYILGDGGADCLEIQQRALRAITELGAEIDVQMITEEQKMYEHGVTPAQAPAVVITKYDLKTARTIPEVAIIKEWVKQLL